MRARCTPLAAVAFVLCAAPALAEETSPEAVSVLALDLESSNLPPEDVQVLDSLVVQGLSRHAGLKVLSTADVRQMIDLETERQALGCDTSGCLAEIAGAMGARYVVYGTAGRLGDTLLVQLNLFDSTAGESIAREKIEATDLAGVGRAIDPGVDRLVSPLTGVAPAPEATAFPVGWAVAAGGAGAVVVGGVVLLLGATPLLAYNEALAEHAAVPTDEAGRAAEATVAWNKAARAAGDWSTWGLVTTTTGAVIVTAGLGAAAGGAVWALVGDVE